MTIKIEVIKEDKNWNKVDFIKKRYFSDIMKLILKEFYNFNKFKTINGCILLSDNAKLHEINRDFRGKDNSTNVVSILYNDIDYILKIRDNPSYAKTIQDYEINEFYIGDIAFSYEMIYNESIKLKKSFFDHFTHLFVHSVLHLLGYTHDNCYDTEIMQDLEIRILREIQITDPYEQSK